MLSADWNSTSISSILSMAAIFPHVLVVGLAPVLHRVGVKRVLEGLALAKLLIGAGAFWFLVPGESHSFNIAVFFLANKVFNEAMCRHGNLVVADLIDEDLAEHPALNVSRSSLYFGAIALFTKPGQALAAMVGWQVLGVDGPVSSSVLYRYSTLVPVVCGAMQLGLWRLFRQRGAMVENLKVV